MAKGAIREIGSIKGVFALGVSTMDNRTTVRVETQYGATDHRHLGQLVTYASQLGAGADVWIAEIIHPNTSQQSIFSIRMAVE